jgi:FAD/FMN-containing dehydrogenase
MDTPPLLTSPRVRAAYAESAGPYRIVPHAVAVPRTVGDVRALVRWAAASGTALVPRGAGSAMPGSSVGDGVIVDLSQGFTAVAVDRAARRARTGASVTWADLTAAARPHRLRLPPDPSSGAFATAGGMAATNAAGPRSVRYGSVRAWIEALEVVGADGDVRWVRRGAGSGERFAPDPEVLGRAVERFPRTRKNSAGYALDAFARSGDEVDLFVGAEGTLGIVTSVAWRLDPIPSHRAGVALGFADLEALSATVPYLRQLDPSAVELLDATLLRFVADAGYDVPPGLEGLLLVEFERDTAAAARGAVGDAVRGCKDAAAHVLTALDPAELETVWRVRTLASPALARLPASQRSLQVIEDGCVPPERLGAYVTGVRAAGARHGIPVVLFGHAGDGHVHVNALPDVTRRGWEAALAALFADVTDLVLALGGTPSGEHGDGRLRAGLLERVFGADTVALFRALKTAYDPRGVFNPGVILPAADWRPLAALKVGAGAAAIPDDVAARLRDLERTAGWGTPKTELAH